MEHFDSDSICSQLHDSTALDLFSEHLIARISSNFYELTGSESKGIPVSGLFHILSHHLLMISSEDDLFSYISSRVSSDPEYLDLLQFVRFDYLECVSLELTTFPDSIDRRLWESISLRLISRVRNEIKFPLQEDKSVDGIISHLTRKHGGNVNNKRIVTITSMSIDNPDVHGRNRADLDSPSSFCSKNRPGQWICWDFHELRICPTHYTIRAPYLKSWVVESSLDGRA
jgi:hypothetical protein